MIRRAIPEDIPALRALQEVIEREGCLLGYGAGPADWGRVFDPHTATAAHVLAVHPELAPAVLVATAHPAKFKDVVEPRIGRAVEMPPALTALMSRESQWTEIDPDLAALRHALG